jgi:hypothetical protein
MAILRFTLCGMLLFGSTALGHDHWISRENLRDPVSGQWCCSTDDCEEEYSVVRHISGGYVVVSTGEVIDRKRVIWRSPGGWWRCRYLIGQNAGMTRCLIGPPQSGRMRNSVRDG